MKFSILFLSLLTTTADADERKGLRGGSYDDLNLLESNDVTVPAGSSVTIDSCSSGDQCCMTGPFHQVINYGRSITGGSGCSDGFTFTDGWAKCDSVSCLASCTGSCQVVVHADGKSPGISSGGSWPPSKSGTVLFSL